MESKDTAPQQENREFDKINMPIANPHSIAQTKKTPSTVNKTEDISRLRVNTFLQELERGIKGEKIQCRDSYITCRVELSEKPAQPAAPAVNGEKAESIGELFLRVFGDNGEYEEDDGTDVDNMPKDFMSRQGYKFDMLSSNLSLDSGSSSTLNIVFYREIYDGVFTVAGEEEGVYTLNKVYVYDGKNGPKILLNKLAEDLGGTTGEKAGDLKLPYYPDDGYGIHQDKAGETRILKKEVIAVVSIDSNGRIVYPFTEDGGRYVNGVYIRNGYTVESVLELINKDFEKDRGRSSPNTVLSYLLRGTNIRYLRTFMGKPYGNDITYRDRRLANMYRMKLQNIVETIQTGEIVVFPIMIAEHAGSIIIGKTESNDIIIRVFDSSMAYISMYRRGQKILSSTFSPEDRKLLKQEVSRELGLRRSIIAKQKAVAEEMRRLVFLNNTLNILTYFDRSYYDTLEGTYRIRDKQIQSLKRAKAQIDSEIGTREEYKQVKPNLEGNEWEYKQALDTFQHYIESSLKYQDIMGTRLPHLMYYRTYYEQNQLSRNSPYRNRLNDFLTTYIDPVIANLKEGTKTLNKDRVLYYFNDNALPIDLQGNSGSCSYFNEAFIKLSTQYFASIADKNGMVGNVEEAIEHLESPEFKLQLANEVLKLITRGERTLQLTDIDKKGKTIVMQKPHLIRMADVFDMFTLSLAKERIIEKPENKGISEAEVLFSLGIGAFGTSKIGKYFLGYDKNNTPILHIQPTVQYYSSKRPPIKIKEITIDLKQNPDIRKNIKGYIESLENGIALYGFRGSTQNNLQGFTIQTENGRIMHLSEKQNRLIAQQHRYAIPIDRSRYFDVESGEKKFCDHFDVEGDKMTITQQFSRKKNRSISYSSR